MKRRETAHRLVAWTAIAFLLIAGWFINPSSTSYLYQTEQGDTVRVHQVDLISFCGEKEVEKGESVSDHVHKDARNRATLLTVGTVLGIMLWWAAFRYVCRSTTFSDSDPPLKNEEIRPLRNFAVTLWFALAIVVTFVVCF